MAFRNKIADICPAWGEFKEHLKFVRYARKWRKNGWKPPFPCLIKRAILKATANKFGAKTFVETGTFLGDTPWFFRNEFSRIFTIEVQSDYASLAVNRFSGLSHVNVIEGDSASRLKDIVTQIEDRALYWLDGHYSHGNTGSGKNETPIWSELNTIFDCSKAPFYIMIDDARCFGENPAYPTIAELSSYLADKAPKFKFKVENDAIHIWKQD